MKISFVSSQAISQAMRYQMLRMQVDLVKAQEEAVTGAHADKGLALGARSGYSVSLARESDRMQGLIDSNALATARLSATQIGLQQMTEAAEKMLGSLATALSGSANPRIAGEEAGSAVRLMTSVLNENLNGEHLFAGINTDVRPIQDFFEPGSPNRVAFDDAFATRFGFAIGDPAAAGISAADMIDFLDNEVADQFLGAGWEANWSSATDQQITSRITLTESTTTSVSANIDGVRKLAFAAAAVAGLIDSPLNDSARKALIEHATSLVGQSITDLANQQAYTGIAEQRVANASERLGMQIGLFTRTVGDMEGIDPYEASTRVSSLLAQIEISYSLTARMQNLSLVRFLS